MSLSTDKHSVSFNSIRMTDLHNILEFANNPKVVVVNKELGNAYATSAYVAEKGTIEVVSSSKRPLKSILKKNVASAPQTTKTTVRFTFFRERMSSFWNCVKDAFKDIGTFFKEIFNYVCCRGTKELQVEKVDSPQNHPLSRLKTKEVASELAALRGRNLPHGVVVTNVGVYKKDGYQETEV